MCSVHAFVIFKAIWHLILYFFALKWIFALQRIERNLICFIWHVNFFYLTIFMNGMTIVYEMNIENMDLNMEWEERTMNYVRMNIYWNLRYIFIWTKTHTFDHRRCCACNDDESSHHMRIALKTCERTKTYFTTLTYIICTM